MPDDLPNVCCGRCRYWSQYHGTGDREKACTFTVIDIAVPPWVTFAIDGIVYDNDEFDALTESSGTDCPAFERKEQSDE